MIFSLSVKIISPVFGFGLVLYIKECIVLFKVLDFLPKILAALPVGAAIL